MEREFVSEKAHRRMLAAVKWVVIDVIVSHASLRVLYSAGDNAQLIVSETFSGKRNIVLQHIVCGIILFYLYCTLVLDHNRS